MISISSFTSMQDPLAVFNTLYLASDERFASLADYMLENWRLLPEPFRMKWYGIEPRLLAKYEQEDSLVTRFLNDPSFSITLCTNEVSYENERLRNWFYIIELRELGR